MRRSIISILLLLTLLLLTACGGGPMQGAVIPILGDSGSSAPADSGEAAGGEQPSSEAAPEAEEERKGPSLFTRLPSYFVFSSGAGAWSTELAIAEDGTFTGLHSDSDMGDLDEELYPNGTVYTCRFSGTFSEPEKVDEHTYSMHMDALVTEDAEGEVTYEDGIRWVTSIPYGLENADEVLIYLPGTRLDTLSEEVTFWLMAFMYGDMPEKLPCYVLYNVSEEYAFVGFEE